MEADWSVELGADDPVIEVPWRSNSAGCVDAAFVDLKTSPVSVQEISEARDRPALRLALERLNGKDSGLCTVKCDAWSREGEIDPIDPLEMDATDEEARFAAGSYIDLFALDIVARGSFGVGERWVRRLAGRSRDQTIRCARTEFVLRYAEVNGVPGFGMSWFVEGCGRTAELAKQRWAEALEAVLPVVMSTDLLSDGFAGQDATMAESLGE